MNLSVMSIVVLVVCIVAANLILVGLRQVVDMPWDDGIKSAVAAGVGALAWGLITPMLRKA